MNRILATGLLFLAAAMLQAQGPARTTSLAGRVLDAATGQGMASVRVELQSPRDTTFVLTGADGSYSISGPGEFVWVEVTEPTFFPYRRGLDLSKRREPWIIKLKRDPSTVQEDSP